MPRVKRSRTVAADPDAVFGTSSRPHHLPRWWPLGPARRGRDRRRLDQRDAHAEGQDRPRRLHARRVAAAHEDRLAAGGRGVAVRGDPRRGHDETIDIEPADGESKLASGWSPTRSCTGATGSGGLPRRATKRQLDEALDGIERAVGGVHWTRLMRWGAGARDPTPTSRRPDSRCSPMLGLSGPQDAAGPLRPGRAAALAASPGKRAKRSRSVVGADHVDDSREARIRHAAYRSYLDLIRLRGGDASAAPDAVVYPASHEEVAGVLEACSSSARLPSRSAVGRASSAASSRFAEDFGSVISLDLGRLDLLEVDERSLPGISAQG